MLNGGAYLHVIYADDHREEADGRTSIIGWHEQKSSLHLPKSHPMLVKRLAVHGTLCIPEDTAIESLKIALYLGEDLVTMQDVTKQATENPDLEPRYKGKRLNPPMYSFNFMLEHVSLREPSVFAVTALVNNIAVQGNRLLITNE